MKSIFSYQLILRTAQVISWGFYLLCPIDHIDSHPRLPCARPVEIIANHLVDDVPVDHHPLVHGDGGVEPVLHGGAEL